MALLDVIRQNRQQLGSPVGQAAPGGQTQSVQELLSAKTGREVGRSGGAQVSSLGEQQAQAQTRELMRTQIQPELRRQQISGEVAAEAGEAKVEGQRQQLSTARRQMQSEVQTKTNQILSNLEKERDQLSLDQRASRMEQAAFLMAMEDKEYVRNLEEIGARKRLDDAMNFQREMQKIQFGDTMEILEDKLEMTDVMSMNDRKFREEMSRLSIEDAIKIADIEMEYNEKFAQTQRDLVSSGAISAAQAMAAQAQAQGINSIISGGIKAGEAYGEGKFTPTEKPQTQSAYADVTEVQPGTGVSSGTYGTGR